MRKLEEPGANPLKQERTCMWTPHGKVRLWFLASKQSESIVNERFLQCNLKASGYDNDLACISMFFNFICIYNHVPQHKEQKGFYLLSVYPGYTASLEIKWARESCDCEQQPSKELQRLLSYSCLHENCSIKTTNKSIRHVRGQRVTASKNCCN